MFQNGGVRFKSPIFMTSRRPYVAKKQASSFWGTEWSLACKEVRIPVAIGRVGGGAYYQLKPSIVLRQVSPELIHQSHPLDDSFLQEAIPLQLSFFVRHLSCLKGGSMSAQTITEETWSLLGFGRKKKLSSTDLISVIRNGLPARSAQTVSEALRVPIRELSTYLHVSSKTLERRLKDDRVLDQDVSDRLVELAKVFARTVEVMEDLDRARKWLFEPSLVLGNVSPVSLLDTSTGVEMVMDELGRIEHGIGI